jgi:dienelactone hydrolase
MSEMKKALRLVILLFLIAASASLLPAQTDGSMDFGWRAVRDALIARKIKAAASSKIVAGLPAESFTVKPVKGGWAIEAADANGALYGTLELAERIRCQGAAVLKGPAFSGRPFLRDRGLNLFLTLPWDYKASHTDYDPQALIDPNRWWFANDEFWKKLFDQMALARLNWLDLHGTWDVSVTDAPNLYAYFIQSIQFPNVGVPPEIKAANLKRLNRIIEMAHARGVRISLMAYEARFRTPHSKTPYPENEADLYAYTREVVEKMIRQAPGLDTIGFRIGESGHGEAFFNCYIEAVKASGRDIPLYTRSWLARKALVVPLAKAARDFTVEIKFNGEQWGTPYMVMGGRMSGWYSYSFEDYLSDSGTPEAARLWPGNPAPGGGAWPAEPYKIVWQVRANGTNRILPVYDPEAVRKAVKSMPLGTASGFVVEGLETYYPKSPRYYMADPNDAYCDWTHERDWMYLTTWGRLGYDPETPEAAFDTLLADKMEKAAAPLAAAWKSASRIVSTAFSAFSLGPDHRNHAIELEWGGDTAAYLAAEAFDTHVFASIRETVAGGDAGYDGRLPAYVAAARLASLADAAAKAASIPLDSAPPTERKRLKELVTACRQAAHLGRYYSERFLSAWRAGLAEAGTPGAAGQAASHMQAAAREWGALASNSFYKPFTERLRMHTNAYHWSLELPKVTAEAEKLAKIGPPMPDPFKAADMAALPAAPILEIDSETVRLAVPGAGLTRAWALIKPLPSSTFFHKVAMEKRGNRFVYEFKREPWGHALAAEIETGGRLQRIPGWDDNAPYLVVPSLPVPTPLIYSSEESLSYLDPAVLAPESHGLLLISSKAGNFHRGFNTTLQRKILDPVRRGLTLVVLAQDYSAGRYTLDWLPRPLRLKAKADDVFDPAGALGLTRIEKSDILRQIFLPSPGWDVPGNGGLAILKWGEGRIVLVNARLIENIHIAGCSAALAAVLSLGGKEKPVVVIDAGTEGGDKVSSVVVDFMNVRNIPFQVLGEVIAAAQGLKASTPVPGRIDDDDLLSALNIRGMAMVNAFIENKVKAAAALPAPATREEFEKRRALQRREVLRDLGLDPLPPRTPLKAKVTGILQRYGYRIEKLAFESRPGFLVTAHLYVPDNAAGRKLPVIVNPHGHWDYKKNEPTVQSRLIGQVLNGYLAIVVDSPGFSFEGDRRIERRFAGTHDDLRLILGSQDATSVYVWDLMRTLDYLATRPEADMTRIGLTGASGGGLATMWAFAAEPRFTCAASVVYASSMEVNPENGCLCNHIPASIQLGDRSDVLGVRAPAPILIIGAEEDVEFPAQGMRRTDEKLRGLWGLCGRSEDAWLRMFPGGHDYSRPMRETAMGFFDKYLKNSGDGSPVPEPAFATEPPESPELFVVPEPPTGLITMRDIARSMFAQAAPAVSIPDYIRLNGGLPAVVPADVKRLDESDGKVRLTFVSEPGLSIPAVYWPAKGASKALAVLVTESGKASAAEEFGIDKLLEAGISCLAIDPRGIGELKGLELRFTTYLGQSPAFGMGWDIVRAAAALGSESKKLAVIGRGPAAGQAALAAALFEPRFGFVTGLSTLERYADAFNDDIPLTAIQPRANYAPPLAGLRGLVKAEKYWSFGGARDPDWVTALIRWAGR